MTSLTLKAPAKINLCLRILDRRADGYHELSMLMKKVSLWDEIHLEKTDGPLELTAGGCDFPAEKNLALRAARELQQVSGTCCGVRIQLTKKIPIGAGLGGGSSDAAAVLKGLNQLWKLHWPTEKLAEIGVKLGADVPFFLYEGPAWVRGIGEKVTPIPKLSKCWIILIYPGAGVDTPWAYRVWDERKEEPVPSERERVEALTQGNQDVSVPRAFAQLLEILYNDFEAVVLPKFPEIAEAKSALQKAGAAGVLMSGSGSAVFGLFEMKEERDRALKKLDASPQWQVFTAEN